MQSYLNNFFLGRDFNRNAIGVKGKVKEKVSGTFQHRRLLRHEIGRYMKYRGECTRKRLLRQGKNESPPGTARTGRANIQLRYSHTRFEARGDVCNVAQKWKSVKRKKNSLPICK